MNNILGIDPGQNGAACLMDCDGNIIFVYKFKDKTEQEVVETFAEIANDFKPIKCYLEKVHSMPGQGVASTFKFGKGFGFLIGILTTLSIPYEFVTPQKWQKSLDCSTGGNKNITKQAAQRLFPNEKITHATADAILITEYGRRAK